MNDTPVQARAFVRGLVIDALLGHWRGAVGVYENRTLPTAVDKLPAATVSTPHEKKEGLGRDDPLEYTTTVTVQIVVRCSGVDDRAAAVDAERLVAGVENAVLGNQAILRQVNHFPSVESVIKITTDQGTPLAEAVMHIAVELQETAPPPASHPLARIEGDVPSPSGPIRAWVNLPQV